MLEDIVLFIEQLCVAPVSLPVIKTEKMLREKSPLFHRIQYLMYRGV